MGTLLTLLALALADAAGAEEAMPGAGAPVDIRGTWHLLVHYTDESSEDPSAPRWNDKVWRFEAKGSRLEWTEYPIVVFDDPCGRFAKVAGQQARVLAYWEPNPGQLDNIEKGLAINSRGSRSKGLRGSAERGYRSLGGLHSQGASVIAYQESWSVEQLGGLPVFTRDDILGSARTESVQGRTQYRVEEVREGGRLLTGRYERDGTQHGSFRMLRTGPVSALTAKKEKELESMRQSGEIAP